MILKGRWIRIECDEKIDECGCYGTADISLVRGELSSTVIKNFRKNGWKINEKTGKCVCPDCQLRKQSRAIMEERGE